MRYIHTTEHHKATNTKNQSQNNNTEESYKHVEQKKLGTKNYMLNDFIKLQSRSNQCIMRDISLAVTLEGAGGN